MLATAGYFLDQVSLVSLQLFEVTVVLEGYTAGETGTVHFLDQPGVLSPAVADFFLTAPGFGTDVGTETAQFDVLLWLQRVVLKLGVGTKVSGRLSVSLSRFGLGRDAVP